MKVDREELCVARNSGDKAMLLAEKYGISVGHVYRLARTQKVVR